MYVICGWPLSVIRYPLKVIWGSRITDVSKYRGVGLEGTMDDPYINCTSYVDGPFQSLDAPKRSSGAAELQMCPNIECLEGTMDGPIYKFYVIYG